MSTTRRPGSHPRHAMTPLGPTEPRPVGCDGCAVNLRGGGTVLRANGQRVGRYCRSCLIREATRLDPNFELEHSR